MRWLGCLLVAAAVALSAAGCARQQRAPEEMSGTLTVTGSSTALPLLHEAKRQFEQRHPKVQVKVQGEGSMGGLDRVAVGTADIGVSQVGASPEQEQVLREHRIAITPYMIIAHRDVPVTNIALDKAAQVFRGQIRNWRELGGPDARITVISRRPGTGSHATILGKVMEGEGQIAPDAVLVETNAQLQAKVAATPGAIGYVDGPTFNPGKVKALKVDQVAYSPENLGRGVWPIYAVEHLYTKGEATGLKRAFLDFVLSAAFQQQAERMKYVPVKGLTR